MSPEREPMENDSNSRTAEELEQQTVDVYLKRKNKIQTYKELSDFYDYSMKLLNQDNH